MYSSSAALGLLCCAWATLVGVHGLLTAVASLVEEHGLGCEGFSHCGMWALVHRLCSCGPRA